MVDVKVVNLTVRGVLDAVADVVDAQVHAQTTVTLLAVVDVRVDAVLLVLGDAVLLVEDAQDAQDAQVHV